MEKEREENLPKLLRGGEVAVLIEGINKEIPLLSKHFLESNIILTIAGLKPQTEFFVPIIDDNIETYKKELEKLNAYLKQCAPHIMFHLIGKPAMSPTENKLFQMIDVENLRGYEMVSKTTNIQGVPLFESSNGWDSLADWIDDLNKNLQNNYDSITSEQLAIGLMKGYPDRAIFDYVDYLKNNCQREDIITSDIPYSGEHGEAQPNYSFYPESLDNPVIKENISLAGEILEDFYKKQQR